MRHLALAAALAATLVAMPATATTITNSQAWNGTDFVSPFGSPEPANTTNYGQSFTSPGGSLTSLTFQLLALQPGGSIGNFRIDVSGWDGDSVTDVNPLWSSADIAYTGAGAYSATPNLPTTASSLYMAFLTVAGVTGPVSGVRVGGTLADTIAGGEFRFRSSGGAAPTPDDVWNIWSTLDLAFVAEFDDGTTPGVPEPGTLALLGIALAGLAASRRRKL